MDPARELGRWLILGGLIVCAVGALLIVGGRLPLRIGRLPGDIAIQGRRGSFYFPIMTCILISAALTLISWFVGWLRR